MADIKIALKVAFISVLPLELDYGKRVPKGDGLASSILGSKPDLVGCPLDRLA
jgi:hypothetical protein